MMFKGTFCILCVASTVMAGPVVTPMGDSITVGYAADEGNGRPTRLQDSFDAIGFDVEVMSVAVGGINAAGYISQGFLAQAVQMNPDVVVINLGANDSAQWIANPGYMPTYQANMNIIFDAFSPLGSLVLISTVLPFAPYDPVTNPDRHAMQMAVDNEINPWLRVRALEIGATLVDYNIEFRAKPFWETAYSDVVHPHPRHRDEIAADYRDHTINAINAAAAPEPSAFLLLGLVCILGYAKRYNRR